MFSLFKKFRFFIIYTLILLTSFYIGNLLNGIGLNHNLNKYDEFIGDLLNFSSILTGFLGALIGVLTSISKSSPIITKVLRSKRALHQFIGSMAIPFASGIFVIFVSMAFRIKLNNFELPIPAKLMNVSLLSMSIFFVLSSVMMSVFVFYIFYFDGFKKTKEKRPTLTPKLRKNK